MGTKRGRLLIRQPRVKRDSDTMNQSPETDYDHLALSHRLLSVPHPKIERHASEPSPNIIQQFSPSSSSHLLSVPQTPYLVKQHSHPLLLPSQSTETHYTLHRQLSYPISSDNSQLITMTSSPPIITSTCVPAGTLSHEVLTPASSIAVSHFATDRIIKDEPQHHPNEPILKSRAASPTIVTVAVVTPTPSSENALPTIRIKGEELQRSISSPQPTRELSLENRSQHCPVIRPGPALGCNFCWNTIDAHGRILRRKTKYHCPECQTNLCIVPCFQEYHERQNSDQSSNESNSKSLTAPSLRQFPKTGSI